MKVITLRNIPPAIARRIEEHSARTGLSPNKAVIQLLERSFGLANAAPAERRDDLDALAGSWSEEDALEFDRLLAEQRQADRELWK